MIAQETIEEFFLKMIEELRRDNIPILTDYWENFRNYPRQETIDNIIEKEKESDTSNTKEEHYTEDIAQKKPLLAIGLTDGLNSLSILAKGEGPPEILALISLIFLNSG